MNQGRLDQLELLEQKYGYKILFIPDQALHTCIHGMAWHGITATLHSTTHRDHLDYLGKLVQLVELVLKEMWVPQDSLVPGEQEAEG